MEHLLMIVFLSLLSTSQAQAPCSSILNAGVYNTFSSSSSGTSYSAFQLAACQDYNSYTYQDYVAAQSSSSSSGWAASFNVAVTGLLSSIIWASGGGSASSYLDNANNFQIAQEAVSQYAASSCSSSSGTSSGTSDSSIFQSILSPQVYQAYESCLSLYSTGVQISQTNGFSSTNLALDIEFVQGQPKSVAYFTGLDIYPVGSATCSVKGIGLPANASTNFKFQLLPTTTYTIVCSLSSTAVADGNYTDLYFSNSVSGAFHTGLFHALPASQLSTLTSQVTTLETQVSTLTSQVTTLQTQVGQLQTYFRSDGGIQLSATARVWWGSNCAWGQPGCFTLGTEGSENEFFTLRFPNVGRFLWDQACNTGCCDVVSGC